MKFLPLIFAAVLLSVSCSEYGRQDSGLSIGRISDMNIPAAPGEEVDLTDYVTVSGGTPPYTFSSSLSSAFTETLVKVIPEDASGILQYGIYVRDSEGNTTDIPLVLTFEVSEKGEETENIPAVPGADGGGRFASGGRGGRVIYVTNLLDDYPDAPEGSLRWALSQYGPKTVMYKVSGNIPLKAKLSIRNDGRYEGYGQDITIAGESAPGDGICLKNWPLSIAYADNVIIRFMRFRLGDEVDTGSAQDAFEGQTNSNLIIDHCSMSWSVDECASFYRNRNFTMQWCILTESLRESTHEKGTPHGYGGIWGGKDASYHHNLISRNDSRNPRFDASSSYYDDTRFPESEWRGNVDFRNNVVYGWGGQNSYGGEGGHFNMVNNYYKEGPHSNRLNRFMTAYATTEITDAKFTPAYPEIHISGNVYEPYTGSAASVAANTDNYEGIRWYAAGEEGMPAVPGRISELPIGGVTGDGHTTTYDASQAFTYVLDQAGAWPRDKVDYRAVTDAANATSTGYAAGAVPSKEGLIDSPSQVGGYPEYSSQPAPEDTDGDGMPDSWESARGLDPDDPEDGPAKTLSSIYTNLEVYLHELADKLLTEKKINTK